MDARQTTIEYVREQDDKRLKVLSRQTSYVKIYNALLKKVSLFESERKLGRGTYGKVHEFSDGECVMAVKKPRKNHIEFYNEEEMNLQIMRTRAELIFTQRAYPADGPYQLFEFSDELTQKNRLTYDSRLLLPFREGKTLHDTALLRPHRDILFYIFYRIAKEVNRIHQQCSIVHGDLSAGNMIISPDLTVKLIDFSFACTTGAQITTFELEPDKKTYIAPERVNVHHAVKGHPNQDVYTLAVIFKQIYQIALDFDDQLKFLQRFPCIEQFITAGLNTNPAQRQSLPDFISAMKDYMFIPKMVTYAYSNKRTELRFLLQIDQFIEQRDEIFQCLLGLLERKYITEVNNIIHQLNKVVVMPRDKAILGLFSFITLSIQDVARIHVSGFRQTLRQQLINDMVTSLALLKLVVNHQHSMISHTFNFAISSIVGLRDIYTSLIETGCITRQRIDMEEVPLTCVFN